MAHILTIPTHEDARGKLSVLENLLPFNIKRVYWMYEMNHLPRGGHRHKITQQGLVCLNGRCKIRVINKKSEQLFEMAQPNQCLYLAPEDWHELYDFKNNPIILLLASEEYDKNDYITEIERG